MKEAVMKKTASTKSSKPKSSTRSTLADTSELDQHLVILEAVEQNLKQIKVIFCDPFYLLFTNLFND